MTSQQHQCKYNPYITIKYESLFKIIPISVMVATTSLMLLINKGYFALNKIRLFKHGQPHTQLYFSLLISLFKYLDVDFIQIRCVALHIYIQYYQYYYYYYYYCQYYYCSQCYYQYYHYFYFFLLFSILLRYFK